ncbi:hypothetical protein SAMN04487891_10291 [Flagellimonas taeanensis]|uniref:Uncharacterized protein n=1 Tax=Flagellimonas taeanensis TaxID=1005926 RepID=A0A1M6RHG9_9FLAO|nr:hypothetical protein SAMN04487891_10291 [Allomuricauda taeanensis]SHK31874.1 hypothetical protein SAMN05216293_0767 [Allomuricauda taeanensis]
MFQVTGCKSEVGSRYEDYSPEDFLKVPGIVTKITRTSIYARGNWYEYNIYYAYNLDSDSILVGREMDVDMAVREGDGIYILMLKSDKNVSFMAEQRILPNHEKVVNDYLTKSKEKGVKYYGVDDQ